MDSHQSTFAAICGLTFASDRRALDYLLSKETI